VRYELIIVGVTHRTAPIEVRESLAIQNGSVEAFARELVELPSVQEAVVLSTCNRVEVVTCCDRDDGSESRLSDCLFRNAHLEPTIHRDALFSLRGREALRHVFRVASSLDSMVIGEPQILGQLKEQFQACNAATSVGPVLHRVFQKSFSVAKRVRTETGVASRAVSIASIAVDLASRIFESLNNRCVMLVGVGEMGEVAARHLAAAGASRLIVANRTFESAVDLAREFAGTPIPLDRLSMYLPLADLVVGSAAGGQLLQASDVRRSMKERRGRPTFFIDLAVPRNFDPAINDVDSVYLYDIDDLGSLVDENIGERKREALRGEAIVEEEVDRFWQWFERLEVVPTILDIRARAEQIRQEEISKTLSRLNSADASDKERVEQMSRALVNKLLHEPTLALKRRRAPDEEAILIGVVREIFDLDEKK
jgi:glutamyl-tRNA reductase